MMKTLIKSISAVLTIFLLAACTPPMPPEVLASLQEQDVYCGENPVDIAVTDSVLIAFSDTIEGYKAYCPESIINVSTDITNADIIISDESISNIEMCATATVKVPVISEAGVLIYNTQGYDGVIVDGETTLKILSGQITNWNDPAIGAANPDLALPDLAIQIFKTDTANAAETGFIDWMKRLSGQTNFNYADSAQTLITDQEIALLVSETEGAVAVVANHVAIDNNALIAGVQVADGSIIADPPSFSSGASKTDWTDDSGITSALINPEKAAVAAEGSDEIALPFEGIGFYNMGFCNSANLNTSQAAIGRYLLRQDAQGTLDIYGLTPLAESLRLHVATIIGEPLPQPDIANIDQQ